MLCTFYGGYCSLWPNRTARSLSRAWPSLLRAHNHIGGATAVQLHHKKCLLCSVLIYMVVDSIPKTVYQGLQCNGTLWLSQDRNDGFSLLVFHVGRTRHNVRTLTLQLYADLLRRVDLHCEDRSKGGSQCSLECWQPLPDVANVNCQESVGQPEQCQLSWRWWLELRWLYQWQSCRCRSTSHGASRYAVPADYAS